MGGIGKLVQFHSDLHEYLTPPSGIMAQLVGMRTNLSTPS